MHKFPSTAELKFPRVSRSNTTWKLISRTTADMHDLQLPDYVWIKALVQEANSKYLELKLKSWPF